MTKEILLCDLCHKPLKGPGIDRSFNGMTITLGHSIGGWGNRVNKVEWSGEVCLDCFTEYQLLCRVVDEWLSQRKGSKMPNIIITEGSITVEPPERKQIE